MTNEITTADKRKVSKGHTVFNYYDQCTVTITTEPDYEGWFDVINTEPETMKRGSYSLNGERICTLTFAKAKGWV